jgi:DNA mismatch repair ATPase MutS
MQKAAPSEKILTVIDEPVKGTVEQTGGKLVMEKARLMTRDNHLLLLATHFQRPTELAQEKPDRIANAYLETNMTDHKTFERTYRLKSGNHPWWFTNDQMRNTFTDWLTRRQ